MLLALSCLSCLALLGRMTCKHKLFQRKRNFSLYQNDSICHGSPRSLKYEKNIFIERAYPGAKSSRMKLFNSCLFEKLALLCFCLCTKNGKKTFFKPILQRENEIQIEFCKKVNLLQIFCKYV